MFPGKWIGRSGTIPWPPAFPRCDILRFSLGIREGCDVRSFDSYSHPRAATTRHRGLRYALTTVGRTGLAVAHVQGNKGTSCRTPTGKLEAFPPYCGGDFTSLWLSVFFTISLNAWDIVNIKLFIVKTFQSVKKLIIYCCENGNVSISKTTMESKRKQM